MCDCDALRIAFALLAAALACGCTPGEGPQEAIPRPITPRGDLAADERSTIELFKTVSPSVAHIQTLAIAQDWFNLDIFQIPQGVGSGLVWDASGHVVTNFHVIQEAQAARVTLADQSVWKAKLVGAYPDKDLAVLKIDAPKARLSPILVGESQDLQVGQKVYAIGNPFGLDHSLTTGIISALGREIESVTGRPIKDAIQTDAAINPGNSGGPLLDSAGRLIGVNTAIYSPSGASAGIGFAIPVDEVSRIVPRLIAEGRVSRPGLGIQVATDDLVGRLGLEGVLIVAVMPGGPAAKAGLQPSRRDRWGELALGDLIVGLDGERIASLGDLYDLLDKHRVGDRVRLTLLREGQKVETEVTLAEIG